MDPRKMSPSLGSLFIFFSVQTAHWESPFFPIQLWLTSPTLDQLDVYVRMSDLHTFRERKKNEKKNASPRVLTHVCRLFGTARKESRREKEKEERGLFFICEGHDRTRVGSTFLSNRAENHGGYYWRRMPLTNYINGKIWQSVIETSTYAHKDVIFMGLLQLLWNSSSTSFQNSLPPRRNKHTLHMLTLYLADCAVII